MHSYIIIYGENCPRAKKYSIITDEFPALASCSAISVIGIRDEYDFHRRQVSSYIIMESASSPSKIAYIALDLISLCPAANTLHGKPRTQKSTSYNILHFFLLVEVRFGAEINRASAYSNVTGVIRVVHNCNT